MDDLNSFNQQSSTLATTPVIGEKSPLELGVITSASSSNELSANAAITGSGTGLKGEYFNNIDFTGTKVTRTDSIVDFNWGLGSPDPSIEVDTFSVRWSGQVEAKYSENYTFYTSTDDGVRLWVNGQQIINQWGNQTATQLSGNITLVAGQKYDIKMEYFDNGGRAISRLYWSSAFQTKEIIPESQLYSASSSPASTGTGLKGEYFNNIDFTGTKVTRTDSIVDFNWGLGSPDPSIDPDTFSVRWSGQVEAKYSENYTFYTSTDDGVRLWVNGQQIINQWGNQAATQLSGNITLVKGQKYDIKMEYFENTGRAVSRLYWSSAFQAKEIIPKSQLYSAVIPTSITLGQSSTTVNETDGSVSITLLRSGDLSGTSSIEYATLAGTATAGLDYGSAGKYTGTVNFAAGESSKKVTIAINDDSLAETDETFSFAIDQPVGAGLGTQRTLGITIKDNDSSNLNFTKPEVNENDGTAKVTVTRGNALGTAKVDYTTVDGTAKDGSDYQKVSGTLSFAVGETSKIISIVIKNDTVTEANETFTLKFSNAFQVGLNPQQTSVTIIDNDSGNFEKKTVASGFTQPIDFDWTPNGNLMYIAEKSGVVKVLDNSTGNVLNNSFIDISGEVNNVSDRGLLSIAVNPNFGKYANGDSRATNYVYLLFTYDPPETDRSNSENNPNTYLDNADSRGNRGVRLVRVTADSTTGYKTAIANSKVVILGKNTTWDNISRPDFDSTSITENFSNATENPGPSGVRNKTTGKLFASIQEYLDAVKTNNVTNVQDFIATDSATHSGGDLEFGTDGSLFVSIGDGTSYNRADPRAIRVQNVDNLSGKVLRINAITGEGLADNPYYNGDTKSNRSKVYDLGLRNPFRFTIDKETNTPVIGDVGWYSWEEVNAGGEGSNFGWPYYEGGKNASGTLVNLLQKNYSSLDAAQDFYNSGKTVTAPIYAYDHSSGSTSVIAGDFYTGGTFNNALFIGNPTKGTIDALTLDSNGKVIATTRFGSDLGVPVEIRAGRDGKLYYVDLAPGQAGEGKIVSWEPV